MAPGVLSFVGVSVIGLGVMLVTLLRARRAAPDLGQFLEGLGYDDDVEGRLDEPLVPRLLGLVGRGIAGRLERVLPRHYLQADALGIPVGRVLRAQAGEVRARRRAWAREKAAKLPVKIMFPLVVFIFPPIMGLVLGPAIGGFTKV